MPYRTDLADVSHACCLSEGKAEQIPGVTAEEQWDDGFAVTIVSVLDEQGAKAIGKPIGTYSTIRLDPLIQRKEDAFSRACTIFSRHLRGLLPKTAKEILVAGIGNPSITPDAIGPLAVQHVMVTRHMTKAMPAYFSRFRPVSAVSPGVLGTTGIETGEVLKGVVSRSHPDCVIAIDALAARSTDRLCTTIQLSDTGIVPGSGIGNARTAVDHATLGVPVIAVGVPTVVDAETFVWEHLEQGTAPGPTLSRHTKQMMVTPREIDTRVADLSKLIGYGINFALHPDLTRSDMELFLS